MRSFAKRLLSVLLCLAILAGFAVVTPQKAEAAHYTDYSTVAVIKNQGDCYAMQGCDSDDTYVYCTKVNTETETSAVIARVHKDTGATTFLTNSATGTYYFSQLSHANDLDVVDINGIKTIFVATGGAGEGPYSLVRFVLSGTTLTEVAHYDMQYNGASHRIAGAQVMSVEGDNINMLFLWGQYVYKGTIGVNQTSSAATMEHLFTMDFTDVNINGTHKDLSGYVNQGFEYYDGKIYVPLTGEPDYEVSSITCWDVVGASGTIKNNPNFSVWTVDTTYVDLSEIESCTICPSDGKMYFTTNRRISSSDANWDGVHYVTNFVYDPSLGDDSDCANYRWNTGGTLYSSNQEGAVFNHAQIIKGTVSSNVITGGQYSLERTVVLEHDVPWIIEWKASAFSNALLMSTTKRSGYSGNQYLYVRKDGLISIGNSDGSAYHNYGINITDHGLSTTDAHTYRIENRIASDGSNMPYLLVDGTLLGAMNQYFVGGTAQGTTSTWLSGKDFKFSYLGTTQHPITGTYSYLRIWGNGLPGQMDEPNTMRWETADNALNGINKYDHTNVPVTQLWGSISDTAYSGYQGKLSKNITLLHDRPWSLEWQGTAGGMLFASAPNARTEKASYLYRSGILALGRWDGSAFQNYGVNLSSYSISTGVSHVYRLTNRINVDGSNMIYLYVDGVEIAPLDTHFENSTQVETGSDWVSGKDFSFGYFGTYQFAVAGELSYIQAWEDGIPSEQPANQYYWTPGTNILTSSTEAPYTENQTLLLGGSNTGTTFNDGWYCMYRSVVLLHNRSWSIEWESEGTWKETANGAFLFSASQYSNEINAPYLYRRNGSDIIAFGVRWNNVHNNYGVRLSDYGIDGTAKHTYRLANRINADGSNMVYLYVDGEEIAPMNRYYEGGTDTGTTVGWLNGRDFVFNYMGTPRFPIGGCTLSYVAVNEGCTHSYGAWTVTKAATCTATGLQSRSCTLCGEAETQALPTIDHSYGAWTVTKASTCVTAGQESRSCTLCGATETQALATTDHSYESTVTAPTCTASGYTTYTCSICGDSYTADQVASGGHKYTTSTTAATCTADGKTVTTCTKCGLTHTETIPATGHSYRTVITAPTCTATGYTTYTCTTCGYSYKADATAATGHSYKNTVVAPGCTSAGYTRHDCTKCSYSYNDTVVAATGHSYSGGTCTVCGAADPDYSTVVTPTLTLKYPTVSFEDVIVMNVYYAASNLEDVVEMGLITYSSNVSTWNISNAEEVIPGYTYASDKQMYASSTNGIAAKNLGDTLYFAVYAKLSDGSYTYTKLVSYSPETYAYAQLSATSTASDVKALVVAMLKYGAAAQTFFGHNLDALVDRNLTADQLALIEAYRSDMMDAVATPSDTMQGTFLKNGGFTNRYPTISFEGAFSVNYYCTPSAAPVNGITMYYWNQADYDAAEVLAADNATAAYIMDGIGTGRYQTAVAGIAAKDLDKGIYVAFVYSDGTTTWTSGVLAYSIGMYCNTNAASTADVAPLAAATAVYGYHAKQTFYKAV